MKRTITILLILISCILTSNSYAQKITTTTYSFLKTTGALETMPASSTQLISSSADDVASAVTDIGFTFWFAGQSYDKFSVNENGLLTLGNTQIAGNENINLIESGTTIPKIAPYWDDLSTGTNGTVKFAVLGTAPSRRLVVQWSVTVPKNTAGAANATFQAVLYETTGMIDFKYGTIAANTAQYSIGIGYSSTDFASVTTVTGTSTGATCAYGTANNSNTTNITNYMRVYFTPDATAPTLTATTSTALASTVSTANRTFTVTIGDTKSGVPTSGSNVPRVYYKKNLNGTYVSTPGVLTAGTSASGTWTFTIDHSLVGNVTEHDEIYYFIAAQDQIDWRGTPNVSSLPSAGFAATDVNTVTIPPTTPYRYKIGAKLSGTKTVGVGGDYTSLTNAGGLFEDINIGSLTGDLTVNITSDLTSETGTNSLNAWISEGGSFSVLIKPVGNRIISGSPGSGLISLNGTIGFKIDGLNDGTNSLLIDRSSSYGNTIEFKNGASNNIITNATIKNIASSGYGVVVFNNTSTTALSNNTVSYCTITSGTSTAYQGILFTGSSSAATNTTIDHNTFTNFGYHPIHKDNNAKITNTTISNNQIYTTQAVAERNYFKGIFLEGTLGPTKIFSNKFYDLNVSFVTSSGSGVSAIYCVGTAGDVLDIYNNVIYLDASTSQNLQTFYGINLVGSAVYNLYYNSIFIGGSGITQGSSYGIYKAATGTANLLNNVVHNARTGGTGKNYGLYLGGTFTSNYNDVYVTGTNGVFGSNGTDRPSLSDWSLATGQDASSLSGDPGFTSTTNLSPNPDNTNTINLNGKGIPIATVSTDYNGNSRNTVSGTTDIGAFEFTPSFVTISGKTGIAGVTLGYTDGSSKTAISDSKGSYSLAVTKGWSGTVTPSFTGYTFTPENISYTDLQTDQTAQDYASSVITYTISGNTGTAGVTLSWTDGTAKTITSNQNGDYTLTVSYNWSGIVTPSKSNYTFSPASISYTNVLTNQTAQNYTATALFISANVKILLEGAYSGSGSLMANTLNTNSLIPLSSETAYPAATYGYTARSVSAIPNADIVDWVLVELRTSTAAASKAAVLAGFIKTDGTIVDIDGLNPLKFDGIPEGSYYIVIRHRNHLAIMTSSTVTLNASSVLYDFTTSAAQAYGTNSMVDLGNGVFAMAAGDTNQSSIVTASDVTQIITDLNLSVYSNSDVNLSGIVTTADMQKIISNINITTNVPN